VYYLLFTNNWENGRSFRNMKALTENVGNFALKIVKHPNSLRYEGMFKLFVFGTIIILLIYLFIKIIPISCIGICFK